jgi:hypothetical protein
LFCEADYDTNSNQYDNYGNASWLILGKNENINGKMIDGHIRASGALQPYGKLLDRFLCHYQNGSLETDFKSEHEMMFVSSLPSAPNFISSRTKHSTSRPS